MKTKKKQNPRTGRKVHTRSERSKEASKYRLTIEYAGGLWLDLDLFLRRHAKRCGGKELGTGFDLMNGTRDIQFEFKNSGYRQTFVDSIRSLGSVFATIRDDWTD